MPLRVQRILDRGDTVVFPGVHDALSAKLAEQAGFKLAFISGYAVSATLLGEPDVGLLTQTEVIDRARQICRSVSIPVIVDADTGYGNALNVIRTVDELIAAGAAGCFLEDQAWPKRCGHLRDKRVVSRDEYLKRIRAAVDARGDRDFFVVARTDALAAVDLEEALARVEAARSLGADATFIEAPRSVEELEEIGRRAPKPLVANMVEHGRTPVLSGEALARLGFQLVLYPVTGLAATARALETVFRTLASTGTTRDAESLLFGFEQLNELMGADRALTLAERYDDPRPPNAREDL